MRNQRGLTFLEVMIATATLVVLASAGYLALSASQQAYSSGTNLQGLQDQVRLVSGQIAEELRQANNGTSVPLTIATAGTGGDQSITFQVCTGYSGGPTWGSAVTYTSTLSDGELDNGLDDNGNGLVDERKIVRTENGVSTILTDWLQESTLRFTSTGSPINTIQIGFTLQRTDEQAKTLSATGSVIVQLRNQ